VTLRTGLVGAGPWAQVFHGPMIASGPGTTLAAVWARRSEAAQTLAAAHGAAAVATFDELLDSCDAVAFAVPPDVQAELAPRAARAGRHLLLEKPLAFALGDAQHLADAVDEAGAQSVLMLRNRFSTEGRAFVASAQASFARGAQAHFVSGASLAGSLFATPWRIERGALFDLGPHVLDLLDAAMGPIDGVAATGDPLRWVCLTTEHRNGALGQIALSITTPASPGSLHCEVFTDDGTVVYDGSRLDADHDVGSSITTALAVAVETGEPNPIDVHRGLYLQQLLDQAQSSLSVASQLRAAR
jgi:predicted dehydrogenase